MLANEIEGALDVDDRYQNWVYRNPVKGAALAGFIATQIGTIWGYYAIGIGLPSLPFPLYNGLLFLGNGEEFGEASNFFVGQSIHFVNGIVFAIMFALIAYKKLPTPLGPRFGSVQKGVIFGLVQSIISIGFLFPYVYAPKSGFDLFSFGDNAFGNNADHWKLPAAVVLWHIVYGAMLGLLYDPKRSDNND